VGYWTIKGKRYDESEYAEYKRQELEEFHRAQEETRRLISLLGEAFTACDKFMEEHPSPYELKGTSQEREHEIYERLRRSLGAADRAPRCEKVREDGTRCGSPQMKGYLYCYAHERMLQTQSQKLELPPLEDANGIQMAIMRVQKALIDDEISEKKARLLLYSIHLASVNLKHTTFASSGEKAIVEMTEGPRGGTSRLRVVNGEQQAQHLTTETQRHGENRSKRNAAEDRDPNRVIGESGDLVIQAQKPANHRGHGGTPRKAEVQRTGVLDAQTHAKMG
jgi:hypothetical protein